MGRLGVLVLVVGFLGLAILVLERISDPFIQSSRHTTYGAAEAAGLFTRGWLPAFVPRSTATICEVHSVDTSEVCATFSVNPDDLTDFTSELQRQGFVKFFGPAPSPRPWCISDRCRDQGD